MNIASSQVFGGMYNDVPQRKHSVAWEAFQHNDLGSHLGWSDCYKVS